ncbi:hypothetical protein THICB1_70351 [Thiomonas arsenitoxydans]|uniref:Uncharacterized protein n=1 Tax=Thiomonas arsenitoxydans (strain DSM 22701 / CIP 110005 / 3As) TaxID=426114 RepID=A0ABP1ZBB3_THIA3|nr:hypothetical protein THICB1_70351 [Thiomonas arsenitoxydans]CQR39120.1 hypothetical protein THICB6_60355 [Thiomonas arsenitoxydans]CQR39465.1 hypothetical protein ACO3_590013 [Thiomonas arsenitoxydans]CQR39519.1 hypothetical protein ACO7_590013 [Thiomonas arsenitoxydans]
MGLDGGVVRAPSGLGNPHPNPPHKWGGSDLTSPTSWGRSGWGRPCVSLSMTSGFA